MYKQVIVVRKDLDLSVGKIAAQVAHASLKSWQKSKKNLREDWEKNGGKKVILQANNLKELELLQQKAKKMKVPNSLIKDAGHTEIPPGTITCLGLGPDSEERIDKLTSSFALLA